MIFFFLNWTLQSTPSGKPLLDTESNSCTRSSLVLKAATLCNHRLNISPWSSQESQGLGILLWRLQPCCLQNYSWKWGRTDTDSGTIPFILSSFATYQNLSFLHCILTNPDGEQLESTPAEANCMWLHRNETFLKSTLESLLTAHQHWPGQAKPFLCWCWAVGCDWCRDRLWIVQASVQPSLLHMCSWHVGIV